MRIVEMINISDMKVPVMLSTGVTVYVAPRESLKSVDIADVSSIRRFFKIVEPINESPVETPKAVQPVRRKRTA